MGMTHVSMEGFDSLRVKNAITPKGPLKLI